MAEIKFSCPKCGQHVSGNEQWSGHQIQCPACATTITVPQAPALPVGNPLVPKSLIPQPSLSHGSTLSAGATQVTRSTTPGPIPTRKPTARPPRNKSPLVKYVVYAVVLAALGGAGYKFLPPLLTKIQDSANSKPAQPESASNGGGAGPLGEVNGAMDASDAMEGGSSSKPRPAAVRKPAGVQTAPPPGVNSAAKSNDVSRGTQKRPR
jgi:DNA-directed RNA polymerase subunit RPC12/RpoP